MEGGGGVDAAGGGVHTWRLAHVCAFAFLLHLKPSEQQPAPAASDDALVPSWQPVAQSLSATATEHRAPPALPQSEGGKLRLQAAPWMHMPERIVLAASSFSSCFFTTKSCARFLRSTIDCFFESIT